MQTVGRREQLQGRAHARGRAVFDLDFGGPDHIQIVLLGGDVQGIAGMNQASRTAQLHARRMQADHLTPHASELAPLHFGAQSSAIKEANEPLLTGRAPCEVPQSFGFMPMQAQGPLGLVEIKCAAQGFQELSIVQLTFAGQIKALLKTLGQARFKQLDRSRIQNLRLFKAGFSRMGLLHQLMEALCFMGVGRVPQDQGALLLEKHRLL